MRTLLPSLLFTQCRAESPALSILQKTADQVFFKSVNAIKHTQFSNCITMQTVLRTTPTQVLNSLKNAGAPNFSAGSSRIIKSLVLGLLFFLSSNKAILYFTIADGLMFIPTNNN